MAWREREREQEVHLTQMETDNERQGAKCVISQLAWEIGVQEKETRGGRGSEGTGCKDSGLEQAEYSWGRKDERESDSERKGGALMSL